MYGDPKKWARRMRAAELAGGTSSSNVSSVGEQIGRNRRLINTEINAGRLSTGLQEFQNADDQENFRVGGPDGPIFLDMSKKDLLAQLKQWSDEDYRSNQKFVRAGSDVLERLFARPNMIFGREEQDAYLRMPSDEFRAFAGRMEENYNAIRNSALHQRNLSILTTERQAGLIQLSSEDLASALARWNANYVSHPGFFMGDGAEYYSQDDITEILDQSPEEFRNWMNQFYGEPDEPSLPDMQGAAVSAQSRRVGDESRSSNLEFVRAGSSVLNRLFASYSVIFSHEERESILSLPPAEFQDRARRIEENYNTLMGSAVYQRDPRLFTSARQARLIQLSGEDFASSLKRWDANYNALQRRGFFMGSAYGLYSPDQITNILDMSRERFESWLEDLDEWESPQGARLG